MTNINWLQAWDDFRAYLKASRKNTWTKQELFNKLSEIERTAVREAEGSTPPFPWPDPSGGEPLRGVFEEFFEMQKPTPPDGMPPVITAEVDQDASED